MAVIELIFPQLKKDPELVKEALAKVPAIALPVFRQAGVQNGLRGDIDVENGKDVSKDFKEIIVLEWKVADDFYSFIKSPIFVEYMGHMKPYATGPPAIDLFETNIGAPLFDTREFLDIVMIRPNGSNDEVVSTILTKVKSTLEKANDSETVYGSSINHDQKIAVIMRAFASKAERDAAKQEYQELLSEVSKLADVTRLESHARKLPIQAY